MTLIATILGLMSAAAILYRIWWWRRYRQDPPAAAGLVRLRGTIVEQPGLEQADNGIVFEPDTEEGLFGLQTRDRKQHLISVDASAWADSRIGRPNRLRIGDQVTIDGMPRDLLQRQKEALYRDSGSEQGIDAVRVMRNTWRPMRGLAPMLSAAFLAALAVGLWSRSDNHWLVLKTASVTDCPAGTSRETVTGPDGILQRCLNARGQKHGAYTIWNWAGALVERGNYFDNQRHGVRDLMRADGGIQRFTYHYGALHGPSYITAGRDNSRRLHLEWVNGKRHGVERRWHNNGVLAFVGYYAYGEPFGSWTYWYRDGRKVAHGDVTSKLVRFWDRTARDCQGSIAVADYWLAAAVNAESDPPDDALRVQQCEITCAGATARCANPTVTVSLAPPSR